MPNTLTRRLSQLGSLSLLDQAVVSGSRFATTILVGRACGPEEFGLYSMGFIVVAMGACVVEALLTKPYTVFSAQMKEQDKKRYAASTLGQLAIVALAVAVIVALISPAMLWQSQFRQLSPVFLVLAMVIPFSLSWEYARRIAFAELDLKQALLIDVAVASIQLGLIGSLAALGWLTPSTAFVAIGSATGLVGLAWVARRVRKLPFGAPREMAPAWLKNLRFGRWLAAAQVTGLLHSYVIIWLLAALANSRAAGVFAACQTIVLLSNPALFSMGNLLGPLYAQQAAERGIPSLRRFVFTTTGAVCLIWAAFTAVVAVLAEPLLQIFGAEYTGNGAVVGVLASCTIWWGMTVAFAGALAAIEQPRSTFVGSMLGMAATALAGFPLVTYWGALGGAWAMAIGSAVAATVQGIAFAMHVYSRQAGVRPFTQEVSG